MMTQPIIQTIALGRPFRLGMLYNRRTDTILPGANLFSEDEIIQHTIEQHHQGSDSEVILGESFEKKSTLFEADANLQLSFLKGSVKFGASGKYLKDSTASENKVEVCLSSNIFTSYKEIDINTLSRLNNTETTFIQNTSATHIVAAIKYGAHVNFNFERSISSDENKQSVEGEMHGMVDNIPGLEIKGNFSGKWSKEDKRKSEKMSCKFFGDLILEKNPTTYEEAVVVYKKLPTLLKGANAPVTVWLYPLAWIDREDNYIEKKISNAELRQAIQIYDRISKLTIASNGLLGQPSSGYIPEVQSKVKSFHFKVQSMESEFRSQLEKLQMDKLDSDEKLLSVYQKQVEDKETWLSTAKLELGILDGYISFLKQNDVTPSDPIELEAKIFENDHVVHVQFFLPFLQIENEKDRGKNAWYENSKPKGDIRRAIKGIQNLKSANSDVFIVVTIHDQPSRTQQPVNYDYIKCGDKTNVPFDILQKGNENKLPMLSSTESSRRNMLSSTESSRQNSEEDLGDFSHNV